MKGLHLGFQDKDNNTVGDNTIDTTVDYTVIDITIDTTVIDYTMIGAEIR